VLRCAKRIGAGELRDGAAGASECRGVEALEPPLTSAIDPSLLLGSNFQGIAQFVIRLVVRLCEVLTLNELRHNTCLLAFYMHRQKAALRCPNRISAGELRDGAARASEDVGRRRWSHH